MLNQYRYQAGQFPAEFVRFTLTGSDVSSFLQAQSTFDVKLLQKGAFHLVAFLDTQGRTESYGQLLNSGEHFDLLVPPGLGSRTLERLNRYLISEDVEVSGPFEETRWFLLGPKAMAPLDGFRGKLFEESAWLMQSGPVEDVAIVPELEVRQWAGLTGWPQWDGDGLTGELITNQRLYDLALVPNKGCYPGQETVSKIATRRGAAYSPVLIEVSEFLQKGELTYLGKKVGMAGDCFQWQDRYYLEAHLLRDFRVEGLKLSFELDNTPHVGTVHYFPLIPGTPRAKAQELFYSATEFFKKDNFESAEESLRLAIEIDPGYADAYESLGVMLGRLERFDEAISLMRKLSEVDPDSVLAHTNLSLYLMRQGKIEEAEAEKAQATLKSFKHFGTEAKEKEEAERRRRAQQEEWQKRESMFLQVLEIDEDDTLANYGIGSIAVERGEWEKARNHLERVLRADPKYSVAYLALGKAYRGLRLPEEARRVWTEGVKVAAAKGDLMPANQMQSELDRL